MIRLLALSEPSSDFVRVFSETQNLVRFDPFRVGLLPAPLQANYLSMPWPAPRECWVAVDSHGTPIGRIGAVMSPTYASNVHIGFFEVNTKLENASQVATQLITAALTWGKSKGATTAIGPINYNTWFSYRFRTDSSDDRQFAWEPTQPSEYVGYFQELNFKPCEEYSSEGLEIGKFLETTEAGCQRAKSSGCTFRPFDPLQLLEREIPLVYSISMQIFKESFLFEPISLEAFQRLYVAGASRFDWSLSRFLLDQNGKEVAFHFCFEDVHQGERYVVAKTLGALPEARRFGAGTALLHHSFTEATKKDIPYFVAALVKNGNVSGNYAKKTIKHWHHDYALYQRSL